jgi:hypothetical protein
LKHDFAISDYSYYLGGASFLWLTKLELWDTKVTDEEASERAAEVQNYQFLTFAVSTAAKGGSPRMQ